MTFPELKKENQNYLDKIKNNIHKGAFSVSISTDMFDMVYNNFIKMQKQNEIAIQALKSIAAIGIIPGNIEGYFKGKDAEDILACLITDTQTARDALKEIKCFTKT